MDVLHGFLATRETGPASQWNGNVALFMFSLFQDPGRGLVCIIASKPRSWNRSRLVHILCPWKDHTGSWKNHAHQVKILASFKRRFSISGEPEITPLAVLKSLELLFGLCFIYSPHFPTLQTQHVHCGEAGEPCRSWMPMGGLAVGQWH